jgi:hypothetical protein
MKTESSLFTVIARTSDRMGFVVAVLLSLLAHTASAGDYYDYTITHIHNAIDSTGSNMVKLRK